MKPALAILAAVLLLAGCGSGALPNTPVATPMAFGVPTRQFTNAAFGVSLRYPASCGSPSCMQVDKKYAVVAFNGATNGVSLEVHYVWPKAHGRPLPFRSVNSSDLARLRRDEPHVLHSGLVWTDGLRLAEVECIWSDEVEGDSHWVIVQSAGWLSDRESCVQVVVSADTSQWTTQRAALLATLASLRFSRPQGPK
jgi:hypothetical protein